MMNSDFKPRNISHCRQKRRANLAISVGILFFFSLFCLLTACSDKKETERLLQKEPALVVPAEPLLPKKYTFLVIEPIAIPAELANDYPKAASDCQLQLMRTVKAQKAFQSVSNSSSARSNGNELIVRSTITDMRLVSQNGHAKGGAFVGSSYINIDILLLDGATKTAIREKQLTVTHAPATKRAATKVADSKLPNDLGSSIEEYLLSIMPKD